MQSNKKNRLVSGFIISTFVSLYLIVSVISTIHVIEFFELSNPRWLAISLAIAFEVGAAASLASLIVLEKMNKFLVWVLFLMLTAMQAMGNTYYAYSHLHDFQSWIELFGLNEEELIYQKRVLSIISGAILPLVALGFIKSLVDYIRPESPVESKETPSIEETTKSDEIQQVPEPLNEEVNPKEVIPNNEIEIEVTTEEAKEESPVEDQIAEEIQENHDEVFLIEDGMIHEEVETSEEISEQDPVSDVAKKESLVVSPSMERRIDAGNSYVSNESIVPMNMGRETYANPSVDIHPTKLS